MPENGYPTKAEIRRLRTFKGTWREYMAYLQSIGEYWSGNPASWGWTEYDTTSAVPSPRKEHVYEISTGHWSGNEDLMGVVERDFLHFMFWESSRRGGHYEYRIPLDMLDTEMMHFTRQRKTGR